MSEKISGLELTNDGRLSLLFLGVGNAFSKKSFQTNVLVVKGQDHLLLDCGTLCPYVLETIYKTSIKSISNILLTHPHADHIGGVEELALVGRYVKNEKCNIVIADEFKDKLWNESLKGGLKVNEEGLLTFDDYFVQNVPVKLTDDPFEIYETNVGSINVKLFRTKHVVCNLTQEYQISYGVIIDDKVLFPSDTQFNEAQIEYLTSNYPIKVIFHDCDIEGFSEGVHASYKQLKGLSPNIKRMMYLCHYEGKVNSLDIKSDGFKNFAKPGVWYRC